MKTAFWFRLRLRRLRSSENWVVGMALKQKQTNQTNHKAWERELWLVYTSPFASDSDNLVFTGSKTEKRSHKQSQKKMETFWFFCLQFGRAYDSDFWFSLCHKRFYDSAYDSVSHSIASENQPFGSTSCQPPSVSFSHKVNDCSARLAVPCSHICRRAIPSVMRIHVNLPIV